MLTPHRAWVILTATSIERAIALPDVPFAIRSRLIGLHLELNQSERAAEVANNSPNYSPMTETQ